MLERRENLDILTWLSCSDVDFLELTLLKLCLRLGFSPPLALALYLLFSVVEFLILVYWKGVCFLMPC